MWLDFLRGKGATVAQDFSVSFPDPEAQHRALSGGDVICPLTDCAWIRISGTDVVAFLQGQLTNDMEKLTADRWQWTGLCNAKGRLLAVLLALRQDKHVLLELPRERAEPLTVQLRKYVLRSKVTVDMLPNDIVAIGTHGERVAEALRQLAGGAPKHEGDVLENGGTLMYRLPGPRARIVVMGPAAVLQEWWRELCDVATPSGSGAWRWLDIVSGLPQVVEATAGEFVPQMLNLDLLDGISFKKGCYTGQEIVARMHYLGRLKQRMVLLHSRAEGIAKPGHRVFSAEGVDQAIGTVVDGQPAPQRGCDLLAVVQLASLASTSLRLYAPDGPVLEKLEMPYALPLEG
jgi:folate-binding protein YgfZ